MRRITVLRLLPSAALMAMGSVALNVAGHAHPPHALEIGVEHFGSLGVAFTVVGWLFVVGFVLIFATVLGAVVVQDEGVKSLMLSVRRRAVGLHHRT